MKLSGFQEWCALHYPTRDKINAPARALRVEAAYGDLDAHFQRDRFRAILAELKYSTEDERNNAPNPSRIEINGKLRTNLGSLASAVRRYAEYAEDSAANGADAKG